MNKISFAELELRSYVRVVYGIGVEEEVIKKEIDYIIELVKTILKERDNK
jgi:hypothetical protein